METRYGYNHPPRAIRDVREQGIPIETFSIKNSQGRTIAAYRFGELTPSRQVSLRGRKPFSKKFKNQLYEIQHHRCAICLTEYEDRYLQVDHRIPYEIAGDVEMRDTQDCMLLCSSCNRAKSWSCEHCANWLENKNPEMCKTCYWASPEAYQHVALSPTRRLDLIWSGGETEIYEQLKLLAKSQSKLLSDYVKEVLKRYVFTDQR